MSNPLIEFVDPALFGRSLAPLSQGAKVGNLVFVAGQVALDGENEVIAPGDIREQTRATIERVRRVLAEVGGDLDDIASATVYLTDMADFGGFNEAWQEAFGDHWPARAAIRADLALPGLLVEIVAIAVVGG